MSRSKIVIMSAAAVAAALVCIGQALSQEAATAPANPRARGNFDPAQMRQRMDQQMKDSLGVTDDEWKALQPKLEKVQTLSRQGMGGGMMGMGARGGRGGRGPGAPGAAPATPGAETPAAGAAPARPESEVQKAAAALQKVLDNKEAKPEDIKTALAALRDARAKAKTELDQAKKELREILTARQEAVLVARGILE